MFIRDVHQIEIGIGEIETSSSERLPRLQRFPRQSDNRNTFSRHARTFRDIVLIRQQRQIRAARRRNCPGDVNL